MGKGKNKKRKKVKGLQALLILIAIVFSVNIYKEWNELNDARIDAQEQPLVSDEYIKEYQESIQRPDKILDPFEEDGSGKSGDNTGVDYLARLHIPKIDVDEPIYLGTTENELSKGMGIMRGTDIPLGRRGESTILAGHRGYGGLARFLWNLEQVELGDELIITRGDETLTYIVKYIRILQPDEVHLVTRDEDESWLTLVTCDPKYTFSSRFERLVVEGELVDYNEQELGAEEGDLGLEGIEDEQS